MQYKLELQLIEHQVEKSIIPQRATDGYVNATAMCQAVGKRLGNYLQTDTTHAFLQALSSDTGKTVSELVIVRKGGNSVEQGTWVHPDVAINLGQWCSPEFAVAVSRWVREWHAGKFRSVIPYHLRRYVANASEIPPTHFSMLNELTYHLIAPLEVHGYTLPEHMVPDISEGRMFCGWLRKFKGVEPNLFPDYLHRYEDGRIVKARLYPIELLGDFRKHFNEVWMPKQAQTYFSQRDPKAIAFFPKAFPGLYAPRPRNISGNN